MKTEKKLKLENRKPLSAKTKKKYETNTGKTKKTSQRKCYTVVGYS